MQHRRLMLFVLTAALTIPPASAWSVNGAFEPDTPDDVTSGRMYTMADTSPGGLRVYFNALPSDRNSFATNVNPNVGAVGSRYLPAGNMGMTAWLGVWKDCNDDGYIGMAETAVNEYRSELLLNDERCPPGGTFNRDGWVAEFIHLSPEAPEVPEGHPRVFVDEQVKVWGDFGRPHRGDEVHWDCAQAPLPSGTMDSTGGALLYFDCQLGYAVAASVNDADAALGLGIGFDDRYHPERDCDNPLNVHLDVYGENACDPDDPGLLEHGTTGTASVWDCSSPGTPVDGVGTIPDPDVALQDPDGSLYRAAWDAAFPCGQNAPEDIDTADPFGTGGRTLNGQFLLGADFSGTNPTDGKRLADFHMGFTMPAYGVGSADPALAAMPGNAGVRGLGSGPWDSSVTYLPPTYLGGTVRNGDLQPVSGLWFTFYAVVGQRTLDELQLPNESPAVYGAPACGDATSGVHNNWDCDATHWWNPQLGGSENPDGRRPGDIYHLLDTDCYDGSLAEGSGAHASLALLSNDPPCPTMPLA